MKKLSEQLCCSRFKIALRDRHSRPLKVVSLHGKTLSVANVGIYTSSQDIQRLVKFQAVILVKLAYVYSTACLTIQSPHRASGLSLQLGILSLAVINDGIEEGNGKQTNGPWDPRFCWFPVEPIRYRLFFLNMKDVQHVITCLERALAFKLWVRICNIIQGLKMIYVTVNGKFHRNDCLFICCSCF